MTVAYILSMIQGGIVAWNYREIDVLMKNGVEVVGFPLAWRPGPYMPKDGWHFINITVVGTLLAQLSAFFRSPVKYISLLKLAIRMKCVDSFAIAWNISREMHRFKVQHIHSHFGDRKLYTGYFCSRILDLPLTVTVHAYEILCNPNPEMFKLAASHCKKVVTISEFNKRELVRVFGIPEDHIEVIHIHGDMSDERMRKAIKILIVASFTEQKGFDILFRALKTLGRDDIVVWVVGEGPLDVKKMAEDEGVSQQTVFLGRLGEDILKILYDACDFFVLPSRTTPDGLREGIPVSIMEAMSRHKAVISTNHVGIPELVPEIIVDENDADGLAVAIAYLADNPDERIHMGNINYDVIKRDFSDDAVLKLCDLFRSSISENQKLQAINKTKK
ncbi:MAG: glycosyltransferase family 4 protein [Armatimonadota bacterium]